jgi:phospholipid/cholesterol/gamma-HCH transport system ATP-binding protein
LVKVRRKMGYLFQSAALFDSFTLNQNLALPLHRLDRNKSPEEINRVVEETLGEVGLGKDGNKMPSALSGGMQKRAGLARALVLQPEILLVDEPASGLDRITASEIDALLMKVKTERHTTMVIVTHDIHGARKIADKFAVLDQGRLLAFGTPQELDSRNDNRLQQFIAER